MAVNTQLPLQTVQVDTATPIRQAQQDQNTNAQAAENLLKSHYENMDEREKSRLSSTIAPPLTTTSVVMKFQ